MILNLEKHIAGRGFVLGLLIVGALLAPQSAQALWGCLFANPGCNWVYYDTDLVCADISLSNIGIQDCVDDPVAPGGGGLPGELVGVHPELDGLVNIGEGPFPGTITAVGRELDNFLVTRPLDGVTGTETMVKFLAFDNRGRIYEAGRVWPLPGYLSGLHDAAVQVTVAGEEILSPFDFKPLGRIAGGDITVSVHVFVAGDGSEPVGDSFFDISFTDLQWSYFGSGAVETTPLSWSAVKAMY